jgi:hypothetical protein
VVLLSATWYSTSFTKADFGSVNAPPISATLINKIHKIQVIKSNILLRQDITEIKVQKVCFPTTFLQLSSTFINIYYFGYWSSIT